MSAARQSFAVLAIALATSACGRAPTPLWPAQAGSIGSPSKGTLRGGSMLREEPNVVTWLRKDARHFGLSRFVRGISRVADELARTRPGAPMVVGDFSVERGGTLLPHFSHRNGRDLDILLYFTTTDGAPVPTPAFIEVGADGLAWDGAGKRFLRFDVKREWALVRALVLDADLRVQWIFVHKNLRALLLAWAEALTEPVEVRSRAAEVMLQPQPGGLHDDHVHVRVACSTDDLNQGCERTGPARSWHVDDAPSCRDDADSDLVLALLSQRLP